MNSSPKSLAFILLASAALACAKPAPAPRPAAAPTFDVIDVMPRFWVFWDVDRMTAGSDTAALIRLFLERVVRPDSAFYAKAASGVTDERIRNFLAGAATDVPAMRAISGRLARDLSQLSRTFVDSFPDFAFDGKVYFYPSLYIRDGGTMTFPPSTALMFGVDMIARLNGPNADLAVLFDHELFHLYHGQVRPRSGMPARLSRRLWGEGLASYVSQRMNPSASELAILLNDRKLYEERTRLSALAATALAHLDDTSSAYARPYLQGSITNADVPPRAGYLIGLRAAQLMGRNRTLRELARLDDETVHREMTIALRAMAAGEGAKEH